MVINEERLGPKMQKLESFTKSFDWIFPKFSVITDIQKKVKVSSFWFLMKPQTAPPKKTLLHVPDISCFIALLKYGCFAKVYLGLQFNVRNSEKSSNLSHLIGTYLGMPTKLADLRSRLGLGFSCWYLLLSFFLPVFLVYSFYDQLKTACIVLLCLF